MKPVRYQRSSRIKAFIASLAITGGFCVAVFFGLAWLQAGNSDNDEPTELQTVLQEQQRRPWVNYVIPSDFAGTGGESTAEFAELVISTGCSVEELRALAWYENITETAKQQANTDITETQTIYDNLIASEPEKTDEYEVEQYLRIEKAVTDHNAIVAEGYGDVTLFIDFTCSLPIYEPVYLEIPETDAGQNPNEFELELEQNAADETN